MIIMRKFTWLILPQNAKKEKALHIEALLYLDEAA
jgi:hypothetical protein